MEGLAVWYKVVFVCDVYSAKKGKEEADGIDMANLITLERLKRTQRQDYLKVSLLVVSITHFFHPSLIWATCCRC